jgi:predicted anti-sigma-YlaC factor YlaD
MLGHAAEPDLIDAAFGSGDERVLGHLAACSACRARLEEVRQTLRLIEPAADVPDPSPLYWDVLRRQVSRRIEDEKSPRSRWGARWLPGFALASLAVAALAVAVPSFWTPGVPIREASAGVAVLPAWSALPPAGEDLGLDVVEAVLLESDATAACADIVDCVDDLDDEEEAALGAAFQSGSAEGTL